ncbi:hypothetical protein A2U01_0093156, partial [Trifolium medium]|nr:hypothetical protein [Trifolium medium]
MTVSIGAPDGSGGMSIGGSGTYSLRLGSSPSVPEASCPFSGCTAPI